MHQKLYHVGKAGMDPNEIGIVVDGTINGEIEDVWNDTPSEQIKYWETVFSKYANQNLMIRLPEGALQNVSQQDVPCSFDVSIETLVHAAEKCGREELMVLFPAAGLSPERFSYLIGLFNAAAADSVVLCRVGMEISDPQTALMIGEYTAMMDFIIFQTEELTKRMYAIANDDARTVVCEYMQNGLFEQSPFCTFDSVGLGTLMLFAICQACSVKPRISFGAEGKPIEEPQGQKFCSENGIEWMLLDAAA